METAKSSTNLIDCKAEELKKQTRTIDVKDAVGTTQTGHASDASLLEVKHS